MKMKSIALVGALAFAPASQADMLGFVVGANAWNQSMTGQVQYGASKIDTQEQLNIGKATKPNFYAAFEHPIPIIPNIRVQQTQMDLSGESVAQFNFGGVDFDGAISSKVDLSHTDATVYYEILDNWVSIDVGLTARIFAGEATVNGDVASMTTQETLKLDQALPMIYGMAKFEIPTTGIFVSARANGIGYDGKNIIDIEASVGYEFGFGLGFEGGYRKFHLDFQDNDLEGADVKVDGAFAGVYYHF